jgi:NAD(P)H-nitrite reductase large subunit
MKYIIIGNGIAGIQAAETIRQMDIEGGIMMIGDETYSAILPSYDKPCSGRCNTT